MAKRMNMHGAERKPNSKCVSIQHLIDIITINTVHITNLVAIFFLVAIHNDTYGYGIVNNIECLLHVSVAMVKNVKLKTTGHFLKISEIISLCWNNALTEQADVLVAKI